MAQRTSLLIYYIHHGMAVYDLKGNRVGTVKYVKLPAGDVIDAHAMNDAALNRVVEALNTTAHKPVDPREHLYPYGFARLDTGLLRADRYILPEQIRSVSADRIVLKVGRDDLL